MSKVGLSDAEVVAALYRGFLHREPDPPSLSWFIDQLATGAIDARSLVAAFASCEEYRALQIYRDLWVHPGHFYSPIVNVAELESDAARVFDRSRRPAGIEMNEAGQLAWVPIIRSLAKDLPFTPNKQNVFL